MELGISGRTALVCGAGGGLGGAIALALAREGCVVVGMDISAGGLADTAARAAAEGLSFGEQVVDLSDQAAVAGAVDEIGAAHGGISILVNNTGGPPPGPIVGMGSATWRTQFEQMVLSVIHLTDLVLPQMREQGWGRIVTSTSSGVVAPIPSLGLSNALRTALLGWSKTLAGEVGGAGITANIILPGRIATARIASLDEAKARREDLSIAEVAAQSVSTIPAGRYGLPQEYGDVVAFLASERASFINGSVIRVDGGMIPSI